MLHPLMPGQFHCLFVPSISGGLVDHEFHFARMVWVRSKHLKIFEQQSKIVCIVALISVYTNRIFVLSLTYLAVH